MSIRIDKEFVKKTITEIIDAVGRPITFLHTSYAPCSVCSGSNPMCPACRGTGLEQIISERSVIAAIEWKSSGKRFFERAGQWFEGDVRCVFIYNAELEAFLRDCKHVIIDGTRCEIISYSLDGLGGNRFFLLAKQSDENRRTG